MDPLPNCPFGYGLLDPRQGGAQVGIGCMAPADLDEDQLCDKCPRLGEPIEDDGDELIDDGEPVDPDLTIEEAEENDIERRLNAIRAEALAEGGPGADDEDDDHEPFVAIATVLIEKGADEDGELIWRLKYPKDMATTDLLGLLMAAQEWAMMRLRNGMV